MSLADPFTFSDRCDGGFDVQIADASYWSLSMPVNDCGGQPAGEPLVIHLIEEDGALSVDPSAPEANGRRRFAAQGRVGFGQAELVFAQRAGSSPDGVRRVGSFRGLEGEGSGGALRYYTGGYGYTVSEGDCRASYRHERGSPGFQPAILQSCDGPCGGS